MLADSSESHRWLPRASWDATTRRHNRPARDWVRIRRPCKFPPAALWPSLNFRSCSNSKTQFHIRNRRMFRLKRVNVSKLPCITHLDNRESKLLQSRHERLTVSE